MGLYMEDARIGTYLGNAWRMLKRDAIDSARPTWVLQLIWWLSATVESKCLISGREKLFHITIIGSRQYGKLTQIDVSVYIISYSSDNYIY